MTDDDRAHLVEDVQREVINHGHMLEVNVGEACASSQEPEHKAKRVVIMEGR
jgi:hypothetical protein